MRRRLSLLIAIAVVFGAVFAIFSLRERIVDFVLLERRDIPQRVTVLDSGTSTQPHTTYTVKRWGRYKGKRHGEQVSYYPDSTVKFISRHYLNGERHGVETSWSDWGHIQYQSLWENGITLDSRTEPPWWGEYTDQELPEDYRRKVYSCLQCSDGHHDRCSGTFSRTGGVVGHREGPCACAKCNP